MSHRIEISQRSSLAAAAVAKIRGFNAASGSVLSPSGGTGNRGIRALVARHIFGLTKIAAAGSSGRRVSLLVIPVRVAIWVKVGAAGALGILMRA